MEMDTVTIISTAAVALLIITNIISIIFAIKKKKDNNEISMDVDDYLTLILEQLDQFAEETIDLAQIRREDYMNDDAWIEAIFRYTKERLMAHAEEYGINSNILKYVNNDKLDEYLLSAVNLVVSRLTNPKIKTEIVDTTYYEDKPIEMIPTTDISADLNKITEEEDNGFYN